ncbi:MAG: DUF3124 domain-containing protein [Saprospiraceae bacterium]|nr:DUF3124 domain-containing protein [Saprospiraceae bacterium]
MFRQLIYISLVFILPGCASEVDIKNRKPINDFELRATGLPTDSLIQGHSYLSVYSQIYSNTEHRTHNLTATISIRNVSEMDSIYIIKAMYFDTEGHLLHNYFENPVYIRPLETVAIVIAQKDNEGGTGANFLFDWATRPGTAEPLFEGIMISTSGQQGLSFTTNGIRIR